ncbi:RDD family protein [Streptomyces ambofaciens]|uniref:RDD family protein n=1 Tax=Streptomyces ambofaciens TaxID=1889 RepID=UPI0009A0FEEF|nr:RDD family protein [Streptomyces ambofaciens]
MSAPTPAPGDDRPREGYYPDPSIPGYVRYWNGASWVPGTSRPAPQDGEPLAPPAGARPSVEETGPHFFDEDPVEDPHAASQHGSRPEPATAWGADRSHQSGFADAPNQRVAWPGTAQGADPRVPHARGAGRAGGAAAGAGAAEAGSGGGPGAAGGPGAQAGGASGAVPGDASAGASGGAGVSGGAQAGHAPGGPAGARGTGAAGGGSVPAGSPGASGSPASPGAPGSVGGARPAQGADARSARADAPAGSTSGETEAGSGNTFVFRRPVAGDRNNPAPHGGADDEGTMTFRAVSPRAGAQRGGAAASGAPGFAAGKAAAARAAAQPATAPSGPQQTGAPGGPTGPVAPAGPAVPHQGAAPQPAAAAPLAPGPGGGQSSWAQQVHRLAGAAGDEQPVAPWKPPVEDVFQAAARRQAAARPAGLGKRLAARLIDTVVLAGVTAVAAVPLGVKAVDHVNAKIDEAKLSGETVTVWLLDGTTSTYLGIVLAVLLLFGVVYEALPTARWGRTLGKKLLGLEVRDIEAHEPPSFGAALRRWLVYSVPGVLVVGLVGVVWCLFDRPWHQCWHDKAAGTFVAG